MRAVCVTQTRGKTNISHTFISAQVVFSCSVMLLFRAHKTLIACSPSSPAARTRLSHSTHTKLRQSYNSLNPTGPLSATCHVIKCSSATGRTAVLQAAVGARGVRRACCAVQLCDCRAETAWLCRENMRRCHYYTFRALMKTSMFPALMSAHYTHTALKYQSM